MTENKASHAQVAATSGVPSQRRNYAVAPEKADNTGPKSSNSEAQDVNTSRASDGASPDTASTQKPVSQGGETVSGQHAGAERTSTDEHVHSRADLSPAEKKREAEKAGQKSMGPEDGAVKHHVGS